MTLLKIVILAFFAVVASTANAFIPRSAIPEVGWNGPGYLCEVNFTLEVEQSECAREDIQLEPWYPPSDTIKSPAGWYSVTTLPRDKGLMDRIEIKRINSHQSGELFRYKPIDEYSFEASFIFVPRDTTKPFVEIVFFKAVQSQYSVSAWRSAPQKSYNPTAYDSVLSRIDFSNAPRNNCINH